MLPFMFDDDRQLSPSDREHLAPATQFQTFPIFQPIIKHNILNHKVMGLVKEPKNIDLSTKSEPWTENELADFRKLMQEIKAKNKKKQLRSSTKIKRTGKID